MYLANFSSFDAYFHALYALMCHGRETHRTEEKGMKVVVVKVFF